MAEQGQGMTLQQLLDKYSTVDDLDQLAVAAEKSERFEEMCEFMKKLITVKKKASGNAPCSLKIEERNKLSVAYKNVVGARRTSWRQAQEQTSDVEADSPEDELAKEYLTKVVEIELEEKCNEVLKLIDDCLLPSDKDIGLMKKNKADLSEEDIQSLIATATGDTTPEKKLNDIKESTIFYLKMCGDYNRYLAEFKKKDEKVKNAAQNKYDTALEIASNCLPPTHPTRLGLVLNASVCKYEIMKKPKEAQTLAKQGFDDAIQKLDSLSDKTYKDSTLIMQLLRDNLTIWNSNAENDVETQED